MTACLDCGGTECICRSNEIIQKLTEACQLFTQGLGDENGYYPNLGQPKTHKALRLMAEAGVDPVFYWESRDLEPLLGEPPDMRAHWRDRSDAGSCNFCNDIHHNRVVEVHGDHLIVRFCKKCLLDLIKQKKDPGEFQVFDDDE